MLRITLLVYLFAAVCCLFQVAPVHAVCTKLRLRKNYDVMTLDERRLYRRALQLSMDRGYYIKFVEMHTEKMSEMEAHRVCMFTYWHRYFLLGFENMLRSLGPEFECVTIPFWDQMQHNAREITGVCPNMEDCAPIIRDLGGSSSGAVKGITINGVWVSGDRCVDRAPLNRFCESSSVSGDACARCLPRNNLKTKAYPSSTNFASVYRQLFASGGLVDTGHSIEYGLHNTIHATMSGTMGTFQAPSDPLFWSHHAYVDLLLSIHFKCRVGFGRLSDTEKQTNPNSFVECPHREDSGMFTTASTVTMRAGERGVNPKQVSDAGQIMYPFFKDLPDNYYQMADITQLGVMNRYIYQIGGLVGNMGFSCDAAQARRLEESDKTGMPSKKHFRGASEQQQRRLACNTDVPADNQTENAFPENFPVDNSNDNDEDAAKVIAWADDARQQLRALKDPDLATDVEEAIELEKMVCLFYDQCRGGVSDYDDSFKATFYVNEPPPCKRIVDEIKASRFPSCAIKLPDWKATMEKYFPCDATGNFSSNAL